MKYEDIRKGQKLTIKGKEFEVIEVRQEAYPWPQADPPFKLFWVVYLHDGSKTLSHTHMLKKFDDSEEVKFYKTEPQIITEKDIQVSKSL